MKIAHLTTVDLSLRFLIFPQLRAAHEAGAESLGISAPGPWVDEVQAAGVRHVPLPSSTRGMNLLADLRAAFELWRVLRRERVDVLHTHNPKPGLYGRVLGRVSGVPIVVNTVHGLYATEDDSLIKRSMVYLLEAIAARFSDAELVQNPEDVTLLHRLRISPRAELLGNGVDLERFRPPHPEEREAVRRELGVAEDAVVVGIVGRLVAEKGYPELFAAAGGLPAGYTVVAVGPDDPDKADALPRELIAQATEAGVRMLGMRDDVHRLYHGMDLFVLPSHREGFPRGAMEAAASGLPVIATDIRGCRQVVADGGNGLLVPVRDPAALAAAIRRVGDDEELRRAMGRESRQRAEAEFDEQRVVDIVMRTYRRVARRKGVDLRLPNGTVEIRRGRPGDAAVLARLHTEALPTGFLPRLGPRFMTELYRALVDHPDAVVLVADDGAGPVGFVSGVQDMGAFYRAFVRRRWPRATAAALPRMLAPSNVRRAWETVTYAGDEDVDIRAELMTLAVDGAARGGGIATRLTQAFFDEMRAGGATAIKLIVGLDNRPAISFYTKMGFVQQGVIEVHSGDESAVMVWRP